MAEDTSYLFDQIAELTSRIDALSNSADPLKETSESEFKQYLDWKFKKSESKPDGLNKDTEQKIDGIDEEMSSYLTGKFPLELIEVV